MVGGLGGVRAAVDGVAAGGGRVTAVLDDGELDDGEVGDCEVGNGCRPHPATPNVAVTATIMALAPTEENGPHTRPILLPGARRKTITLRTHGALPIGRHRSEGGARPDVRSSGTVGSTSDR